MVDFVPDFDVAGQSFCGFEPEQQAELWTGFIGDHQLGFVCQGEFVWYWKDDIAARAVEDEPDRFDAFKDFQLALG